MLFARLHASPCSAEPHIGTPVSNPHTMPQSTRAQCAQHAMVREPRRPARLAQSAFAATATHRSRPATQPLTHTHQPPYHTANCLSLLYATRRRRAATRCDGASGRATDPVLLGPTATESFGRGRWLALAPPPIHLLHVAPACSPAPHHARPRPPASSNEDRLIRCHVGHGGRLRAAWVSNRDQWRPALFSFLPCRLRPVSTGGLVACRSMSAASLQPSLVCSSRRTAAAHKAVKL